MAQDIGQIFGERLRALREKAGLTQEQLAKALNINRGTLGTYEGGRVPGIDTLDLAAKYFNVPLDYLMGRTSATREKNIPVCDYMGITEKSAENIRSITQSGSDVDILLERDELKGMVEILNKIKTISVGKRYYNERIKTEFEELLGTISPENLTLHGAFFNAIHCIEERHLSGDMSDNPYDIEKQALPGINDDEVYTDKLNIAEYRLTKDFFNKMIEAVENDTTLDEKLFKNFDYKVGEILDHTLINLQSNLEYVPDYYTGEELNTRKCKIQEDIKALEEFIKLFNKHYRKDDENNG